MRTSRLLGSGLLLTFLITLAACDFGGGEEGDQAQIRLLNVSSGYDSVDLYTNNNDEDDDDDAKLLSAVSYKTVSAYSSVDSDTYTLKFKKAGASSTLLTLGTENLTDESHATYVGYGPNGHFATIKISEDVTDPDSGNSKVNLLNTAEAGSLDVYLTDDDISLDDATPTFSSIDAGAAGNTTTIDSGTYRLRVTGAGDTGDLRLDVPSITFSSKQIASIILTATPGGVLVNALVLPQEGSVTAYDNTKARVRGAAGVANGSLVSLNIGGANVLSNVGAGVIGAKYAQIESGAAAITLTVGGSPVSVSTPTLTAGADYTMLVYTDSGATQTNLIADDNRLPSSSSLTKIRLLNGMSARGTAITMYVDYSPVIEGTQLGQASAYTEVDSGTDVQIDVTETNTAATLLTKTGLTLQSAAVYTMFVSGGDTLPAPGFLRKDR